MATKNKAVANGQKAKKVGRPPFSFFLIDLPSDHEVDEGLSTECEVIRAILSNRGFKSVTKTARISSVERFGIAAWRSYPSVGYVHLATHGLESGSSIALIGGTRTWTQVASKLKTVAPRLQQNRQRVLTLSCCYSENGFRKLKPHLKGHFTGCYYFAVKEVGFSDAITDRAMFYKRKTIARPHRAIVDRINDFFDQDLIAFDEI
jgi:hypothetical protein